MYFGVLITVLLTGTAAVNADCKTPAAISNGNVTLDTGVTTYNATATLACKRGYIINGSSSIRCQNNTVWSTGGTCQKISCGDPISPANGNITQKTGTLYGDVATVICNVGYNSDVTSSNTIQCSANGQWSPTINCLIVNCGSSPSPANGSVSLDNGSSTFQSTATQKCSCGYNAGNVTQKTISCQSTGKWETGINCAPNDCGSPPAPANGTVTLKSVNTLIFSHATQSCSIGYKAVGSSADIFCLDYGWSTDITGIVCQIRGCGDPIPPTNGNITQKTGTLFGDVATVACNVGNNSVVTSSNTIVCTAKGTWSPTIRCLIVNCGSPPSPENGVVSLDNGSSTFQSTATQKCNYGYNAGNVAQKTITCQSTGKWERGINCAPKDCGSPPAPANGTVTLISVNTLIFSKATQYCNIGYKAIGSSADIFCLDYGWSINITGIVCQIRS